MDAGPSRVRANGIELAVVAAGPRDGPLVVLLHGFPELSRSWRHQLPALAAAGYRAVAPDLRGYGRSDKRGPYDLPTLAADVAGIVRALGRERAVVVGHDWGGAVAWAAAMYEPRVVERLVILDCPHPEALASELVRNPRQLRRSLYMLLFQVPRVPEWWLTRHGASAVGRALRGGSHVRSAWPREETQLYQRAFLAPGSASAALGYYRAAMRGAVGDVAREAARGLLNGAARGGIREALRRAAEALERFGRPPRARVVAPTLILWGAHDRFLGLETIAPDRLRPYLADGNRPTIRIIDEAGHFVQNEAPDRVNEELLAWLGPAA